MTKPQDYIFCPLCGEHEWKIDKTKKCEDGHLTDHRCGDCKKFFYTEVMKHTKTESGLEIFYKELYEEQVFIEDYDIMINHFHNWTQVKKDYTVILKLPRAVKFDWYRDKDIKDKIKKFLVFS